MPRTWLFKSEPYEFSIDDLTTYKTDMAQLTGVAYGGVAPISWAD